MAQSNWEADKMLDVYIYDYLLKRNLQATAKAFMAEGKVAADPVAIDAPGGFLFEWWSVFWDIFIARTNEKHSEVAAAYIEAQQIKAREQQQHQQQLQMQQLQLIQQRHGQLQRRDASHPSLNGPINGINSDGILGSSTASVLAAKMYEERMKHPHSMDPEGIEASRMALLKSATNHPGQLVQGNPGSVTAALQQIQARNQQTTDIKPEVNLGVAQRSLPMDPSSIYGQGIIQSKSGIGGAGLNQGVSGIPLKGWPLTGIDQIRPSLGPQVQKPFLSTQNHFQLLSPQQQQQILAQAHAQGNLGSSPNYGDLDPRRFRALPRGSLSGKDGQPIGNDGSVGSPIQSSSPKVRPDQAEFFMKLKAAQMQQSSAQQPQEQLQQQQQQQLQQNNRKRKQNSSSGAANSTGTGNTVGPSNSPPSTPSTHTPGDGVGMAGNISMPKSLMMYGTDGTGTLASSSNQMDDLEHFGDVASLDDNVESFLSHDDGDARDIFAALKRSPAERSTDSSKGFTFTEVSCIRTSNSKVVCCHFSSDGKLLASGGHEKKAVLWNMDTLQTQSTPEDHTHIITDVRFRPNSTQLATSSFDRTVRLWNAADPGFCLHTYTGHSSHVTSLDFHPKKTDLLCSCDGNGEIRFWNVSQSLCSRVSKVEGGMVQVRFQPRIGKYLAAAADNVVSIFDVETDIKTFTLQGHTKEVPSICWDANGEFLASVSQDSVKVWSVRSGDCIHELSSNGNKFHSCVFHPSYSTLLVIGGYQSLELWNMAENQKMTVEAHEGLIAALAQSPVTGMVASASHDKSVKLWK